MIFLVGFMGSGKSTVGPVLGARLGCEFTDLDAHIEAAAGCPIHEIFDRQGEAAFRDLEYEELGKLLFALTRHRIRQVEDEALRKLGRARSRARKPAAHPGVVALGGGAFTQRRNIELIENNRALSVWLDAPAELLLARCAAQPLDRPLARDRDRFLELYAERLPFYARASVRVNAAAPPADVVEEILAALGGPLGNSVRSV